MLPVAIYLSQLQTMASETEDPLPGSYPHHTQSVLPELHVLHDVNAQYKSQDLLQRVRREHATFGMPGKRTAWAATWGMSGLLPMARQSVWPWLVFMLCQCALTGFHDTSVGPDWFSCYLIGLWMVSMLPLWALTGFLAISLGSNWFACYLSNSGMAFMLP